MEKTALITGATSGVGKATAKKLADHGYNLIICGRRKNILEELKESLTPKTKILHLAFDLRNRSEVAENINTLPDDWKNIDILINNAGNAHGLGDIHEGDINDWDAMIDGNTKGLLYISRSVIPQMVKRKTGHIINVSSIAGKQTYVGGTVYCASKKAVEAISEGMRLELTKHNIKVTNIAPGAIETEFSEVRFKGDKKRAEKIYEGFEPLIAEDIADFISYILHLPERVNIADVTILPKAQSAVTTLNRS
ncbi:SDR family NAD(P)-dependent oxidoreductase [Aestuariivivens sediminis]|uniref:SDR family NAD(P)-dependent oxidoreductase n=1 Tax=Aestuariivivens sediminis TaxID=2913557 RepID=UPI001F5857EA|nr:SDR family NAD(P)-dependent oxidoreductase [Aestuariivivens sediminis]